VITLTFPADILGRVRPVLCVDIHKIYWDEGIF